MVPCPPDHLKITKRNIHDKNMPYMHIYGWWRGDGVLNVFQTPPTPGSYGLAPRPVNYRTRHINWV